MVFSDDGRLTFGYKINEIRRVYMKFQENLKSFHQQDDTNNSYWTLYWKTKFDITVSINRFHHKV